MIDIEAVDKMAAEAARINRQQRREIQRLRREVGALWFILGALAVAGILWWLL